MPSSVDNVDAPPIVDYSFGFCLMEYRADDIVTMYCVAWPASLFRAEVRHTYQSSL